MTQWETLDWVQEVQQRGAGEIVLNMMNQDGVRNGYDLTQLKKVRGVCRVPLIASAARARWNTFLRRSVMPMSTARLPPPFFTSKSSILAN
ncbi:cyclase HisF [Salmonella enterica subsp. diarizonae]|uniref:Cyclase HisF n=1 Tax=Salmonella diarizonae TaxID=59204 RepID=A0A379XX96_SALDZ|nr:cyclase HisF [Salmonella enterica subsp. diarizonae]